MTLDEWYFGTSFIDGQSKIKTRLYTNFMPRFIAFLVVVNSFVHHEILYQDFRSRIVTSAIGIVDIAADFYITTGLNSCLK